MAKLVTRPLNLGLAIVVGLSIPSLITGGIAAIGDGKDGLQDHLATFLVAYGFTGVLMLVPGAPIWWICHRRGARAWIAALTGGATGLLTGVGLGLMVYAGGVPQTALNAFVLSFLIGGAALIGAVTCALMWLIAYPKSIRPASPAEVF